MMEKTITGKTKMTISHNDKLYTTIAVPDPTGVGTDTITLEGEMPLNKEVEITVKIEIAPY